VNSRERVLTTFDHHEPDRVPINYMANPGIDGRLKEHFGLKQNDYEGLQQALGVDFRWVHSPYTGPKLHADIPERNINVDNWGIRRRWVEHPTGGYWDYCDFPLKEADLETVVNWPMPSPDDFNYTTVYDQCKAKRDFCLVIGGAGIGDIINSTGMVRGMEQTLVDLILDEPAGITYIDRRLDVLFAMIERTLEAAKGEIDILWMGEDLGTQIAPMISLDLYREQIRPRHQRFVDLAKAHGARVMMHSCGSSSWAYEDFIAMGIDGVETLQPEAANMDPAYLKKTFGSRLTLHGCISTAGPVATGSVAETISSCRETLATMMPGGGYCFAPTHELQDNSPTANVVAMYEVGRNDGSYR
jgi:uroporphyrinogen decarboxylase